MAATPGAVGLTVDIAMQDSVPKFLKEPRYQNVLREHNFDHVVANGTYHSPSASLPERTLSRTARAS